MKKTSLLIILFLSLSFFSAAAQAKETMTLLLTSNLWGRFNLEIDGQEKKDPLLLLGQSIIAERTRKKNLLYLDVGNAFYPGALSRYSYGSAVMDFFGFIDCRATLVSSRDIRIGVDNLAFHQGNRKTALLSANIQRDRKTLYAPYFIYRQKSESVAFIGLSSHKILFDITEKNIYNITLEDARAIVRKNIDTLRKKGIKHFVLLSGLNTRKNMELMKTFSKIGLIICGGDNRGRMYGNRSTRIDLADGRRILFLSQKEGYYLLDVRVGKRISPGTLLHKKTRASGVREPAYQELVNRLAIWKEKFKKDEDRVVVNTGTKRFTIDDTMVSHLLRDVHSAEIVLLKKKTVVPFHIQGEVKRFELLQKVTDEFVIFTYKLSGKDVKTVVKAFPDLFVSGLHEGMIQGYPLEDTRIYKIASTQRVFERVKRLLQKEIVYRNTWKNISDEIVADLKGERVLLRDDHRYLERSFRATVDVSLSGYIDRSTVKKGEEIPRPPGQPETTYYQWGMEGAIDFTLYNRYHQFILTPYIHYIEEQIEEQEKTYLKNLLRGTFLYKINLSTFLWPYHKSQCDTVVRDIEGERPAIIRETVGANILSRGSFYRAEGRMGVGFEKQVKETQEDPIYGVEIIADLSISFLKYFIYSFKVDTFISKEKKYSERKYSHLRSEMENSLSFKVNSILMFSVKHKRFYFYSGEYDERYSDSQILASMDVKTNFKIY